MGETTAIPALDDDGAIPAYVARPSATPRAAIIVVPEIFGVNEGIRRKCDGWAAEGYLALAPDIFWRFAPGVELDPDVPEQLQQAFGYFQLTTPTTGSRISRPRSTICAGARAARKSGWSATAWADGWPRWPQHAPTSRPRSAIMAS